MQGKDALKMALTSTQGLLNMYLGDLSDEDMLVRPVPGANHIAWQLGHLITSEKEILRDKLPGAVYPDLPAALDMQYYGKKAELPPGGYLKKAESIEWFNKVRGASLANLDKLTDADLDKPNTGSLAAFAPTLGALIILVANHTLMHGGQFTVIRRALNKPILM